MKRLFIVISFVFLTFCVLVAQPKRELRSAWVATVYALDWPDSWGGGTANTEKQKAELLALIDSLHAANFNAYALQVRSWSDAMYNSKYEPWSQYLTGTRGGVPAYDPLQYAVEESHKRGIAVHVWINPYRYSSNESSYGKLETDYSNTHPEWLIPASNGHILNPGLPEVRQRIADIIADILEKYDIDGVIFDDYFYHGAAMSIDKALYNANNPKGLSQADWRREQVNEMVRMVHDTIKAMKPWVDFGIGPPPQVASSSAHAAQYGVDPCPFSDWQYSSEYSDPLAWYKAGTVDYMAPQAYWPMESNYSFATFSKWWAKVAEKFGRHVYMSHGITGPSGNLTPSAVEMAAQVEELRDDNAQDAPGSVYYSIKSGINRKGWVQGMKNLAYQHPALPPQKMWQYPEPDELLFVKGITYMNKQLVWSAPQKNLSYAVYKIPRDSMGKTGVFHRSDYLLGRAFTNSFTCDYEGGYVYAVAVLDRNGNEHPPVVQGNNSIGTTKAAQLTYPLDGEAPLLPAFLHWQQEGTADSWFVQIAEDKDFKNVITYVETGEPQFYTGKLSLLKENTTYYWRVRSRSNNARDAWSEARSFLGNEFSMEEPLDNATEVSLTPLLRCDSVGKPNLKYTFDVSLTSTFNKTVYSGVSTQPRIQLTDSLLPVTTYYARVTLADSNGDELSRSKTICFKTKHIPVEKPQIISPADGDTIVSTTVKVEWRPQNAKGFRLELSTVESFATRQTKMRTVEGNTYIYEYTDVEAGDYYLRVRAQDENSYVNSDVLHLVVQTPTAVDYLNADETGTVRKQIEGNTIVIVRPDGTRYTLLGTRIE